MSCVFKLRKHATPHSSTLCLCCKCHKIDGSCCGWWGVPGRGGRHALASQREQRGEHDFLLKPQREPLFPPRSCLHVVLDVLSGCVLLTLVQMRTLRYGDVKAFAQAAHSSWWRQGLDQEAWPQSLCCGQDVLLFHEEMVKLKNREEN